MLKMFLLANFTYRMFSVVSSHLLVDQLFLFCFLTLIKGNIMINLECVVCGGNRDTFSEA